MNGHLIGFVLLVIVESCLCCSMLDAQTQGCRKVSASEMLSKHVYKDGDIPDAIMLQDGKELPVLRSFEKASEIIEWADKHDALLFVGYENIVVAMSVDTTNGIWVLFNYMGTKQFNLATVATIAAPTGMSISCAVLYPTKDTLFALTQSGSVLTSDGLDIKTSQFPKELEVRENPCQHEYMRIPKLLSIPKGDQPESMLLAAKNRNQIATWARDHDFSFVQSIGNDHLVLARDVGSGIFVEAVLVYVRTTVDEDDSKPWKLACVGYVGTYLYYPVGMYIDEEASTLVLIGARGDRMETVYKIGMLKLSNFTIHGRQ